MKSDFWGFRQELRLPLPSGNTSEKSPGLYPQDQVKALKMSYAEELKSQIAEQAANKLRERNERMGLGVAASHNAVSGERNKRD